MSRFGGNPPLSPYASPYVLYGRLYGGGTGPTAAMLKGATYSRGGTGKYVFYPDVNYPFFLGAAAMVHSAAGNTYAVEGVTYYAGASTGFAGHTAGATAYVGFQVTQAGTATDLAANDELWFHLAFSRTMTP